MREVSSLLVEHWIVQTIGFLSAKFKIVSPRLGGKESAATSLGEGKKPVETEEKLDHRGTCKHSEKRKNQLIIGRKEGR